MKKENIEEIEIEEFKFNKEGIDELSRTWYNNWPVVYILNNQKEAYIGETNNSRRRMKQHKENKKRGTIKQVRIISNRKFNESAVKNIEALLIRLMHADKKFILQNETEMNKEDDYEYKNNYYQKAMYEKMIYQIWNKLEDKKIVESKIEDLKNTNIFKYSPYTSLNQEQKDIAKEISENILNAEAFFIEGLPGTGKTILAIYLAKLLTEQNYKVGLVISMTSLRNTVSQVFKNTKGLKANMVIGPSQVFDKKYDVLIVDEAHRLRMKKGLRSSKSYDKRCDEFKKECKQKNKEIPNKITELDWIGLRAERKILFYDEKQKV